jgi:SAM-dependent methyltransferase
VTPDSPEANPSAVNPAVEKRMRAEWNERAQEDAHYYVAFGRRDQDDAEFFATAKDLVRELVGELKRLPANPSGKLTRALEIGCGPGRLLRPMSQYFSQIYGVDVSDAMVALAKEKLRDVLHAFPHAIGGSDLKLFPDQHFDFVYSYAVFQHIPDADVVFSYLRETVRVLRPGGVARLQLNGLPKSSRGYTTWEGVRIGADEIQAFTREHGIELLALTGIDSQYMWTTWRKPLASAAPPPKTGTCRIRAVSNAFSSEQAVPAGGRLACVAASVENLPAGCDLNSLTAFVDGLPGRICYIGPRGQNSFSQVNVFLPKNVRTGLLPLRIDWYGRQLAQQKSVRVIPPGPAVPRLNSLTDAVNLMSAHRIESRLIKASIEEVDAIEAFRAIVDGVNVENIETFRADPLTERWEVNFEIPRAVGAGDRILEIRLGTRMLARMGIEVANDTNNDTSNDTSKPLHVE